MIDRHLDDSRWKTVTTIGVLVHASIRSTRLSARQRDKAFQVYRDQEAAGAFLNRAEYAAYLEEVEPMLTGDPAVTVLDVQWSKPVVESI